MIFSENEYVLISTNTRINISTGFIAQRKEDSITILLDRYKKKIYLFYFLSFFFIILSSFHFIFYFFFL